MPLLRKYNKQPLDPACQPYVDAIAKLMAERGFNTRQMIALLYDQDINNLSRGIGADFYVVAAGKKPPGNSIKRRFLEKTGLDLSNIPYVPSTPVKSAVAAYEAAKANGTVSIMEPIKKGPPRFSIVLHNDGTADVICNFIRISTDDALKCFAALKTSGVFGGEQS